MKFFAFVAVCGLALAGCQTSGNPSSAIPPADFDAPIAPGATRLDFNPDRDRWVMVKRENGNIVRGYYACKPLACEQPTMLVYSNGPSPTRKPDADALRGFQSELVAKKAAIGGQKVTSKLASMQGYPAIWMDYVMEKDGNVLHFREVQAFVGSAMIGFMTSSKDPRVAHRHLDEGVKSLRIKDGGSATRP